MQNYFVIFFKNYLNEFNCKKIRNSIKSFFVFKKITQFINLSKLNKFLMFTQKNAIKKGVRSFHHYSSQLLNHVNNVQTTKSPLILARHSVRLCTRHRDVIIMWFGAHFYMLTSIAVVQLPSKARNCRRFHVRSAALPLMCVWRERINRKKMLFVYRI